MARFREQALRKNKLGNHYKTLYVVGLGVAALTLPLILMVVYIIPIEQRLKTLLAFAVISSAIHLFYNLTQEGHKAAHDITRYSAVHSTQLVLSFAVGICLVMFTPLREAGPFIGMIIGGAIALLVELPGVISRIKGGAFDTHLVREYFIYGTPICFSLILAYALENGDLLFIKYFMNDAAVGAYSAGYNLASRSFDFIFVWLAMAAMPVAISALERKGKDEAKHVLAEYCDLLILITLPAAVGIAIVSKEAVFVLGEPVRQEALIIMPWIAFAALLNGFINYYVHQAFVLTKRLNLLAALMIVPVIINFGLNMIFIPRFGLYGAVIATLCAYSIAVILTVIVARRIFTLPLQFKTFSQCSLASAVMGLCVFNLPIPDNWPDLIALLAKSGLGVMIYGLIVLAMNTADVRKMISPRSAND